MYADQFLLNVMKLESIVTMATKVWHMTVHGLIFTFLSIRANSSAQVVVFIVTEFTSSLRVHHQQMNVTEI